MVKQTEAKLKELKKVIGDLRDTRDYKKNKIDYDDWDRGWDACLESLEDVLGIEQ